MQAYLDICERTGLEPNAPRGIACDRCLDGVILTGLAVGGLNPEAEAE